MSHTPTIYVDHTHCGRHVTGLERITLELFSREALAPLAAVPVRAGGRKAMMWHQTMTMPGLALAHRSAIFLCPGFPPSIPLLLAGGLRVIPYIHDLFLLTRPEDLNRRAKLYMVAPFRMTVQRARLFLVNSQTTADELRRFCRPDAEIVLYRPAVRNVFGLTPADRGERRSPAGALKLAALGTVEPRKNLFAAAAILTALRGSTHPNATLDVVGRPGWGVDAAALGAVPGVTLHGYQPSETVSALVMGADALISTSHDEGLGLPLLEAQYAGLPVIAPDRAVFREVLQEGGILVDAGRPEDAARAIAGGLAGADWRASFCNAASTNLRLWNSAAARDHTHVIERLSHLTHVTSSR